MLTDDEINEVRRLGRNDPTPIWMDDVRCHDGTNYLRDCCKNEMGVNNCTHDNDVYIACEPGKLA